MSWELIEHKSLSSFQTATFSSLPQNYTDLMFFYSAATNDNTGTRAAEFELRPNGSTSSIITRKLFIDRYLGVNSVQYSNFSNYAADGTVPVGTSTGVIYFKNYSTTKAKVFLGDEAAEGAIAGMPIGIKGIEWNVGDAITSFDIYYSQGFGFGKFTLYGISY